MKSKIIRVAGNVLFLNVDFRESSFKLQSDDYQDPHLNLEHFD